MVITMRDAGKHKSRYNQSRYKFKYIPIRG